MICIKDMKMCLLIVILVIFTLANDVFVKTHKKRYSGVFY